MAGERRGKEQRSVRAGDKKEKKEKEEDNINDRIITNTHD